MSNDFHDESRPTVLPHGSVPGSVSPDETADTLSTEGATSPPNSAAPGLTRDFDPSEAFDLNPNPEARVSIPGYTLLEELGRGGMGVVYKVRHEKLNRFAALKLVLGVRGRSEGGQLRFLAEAEAMAAIRHRNVVQIYEFGERDGNPFLILEYLSGGSLADRLKGNRRLEPREAAGVIAQVARGVGAAHTAGIVHRDLKPGNILFDSDGSPKLTDFGLAKRAASDLTATLAVMGTPAYMAPEQAGGRAKFVGPPADVWALGVVLYECLVGARPFDGTSTSEILAGILTSDPAPVPPAIRDIPRDLDLICRKCLEKNPADRYPTAEELADDLERFLVGEPISVRPVGCAVRFARCVRRNPAVSALGAFVLLTVMVVPPTALIYRDRLATAEELAGARTRAGDEAIRAASEARRAAAEARRAETEARQAATTKEYFHLLSRVHRYSMEPRAGWTWAGLSDLATAAGFADLPARDVVELRSAAAACLAAPDVREVAVATRGTSTLAIAFRPDGKQVAVCELKAWAGCRVFLLDPETGKSVRDLSFSGVPVRTNSGGFAQDGGRSMAYSPDGRWLFVGCRSGHLRRWDLSQPGAESIGWTAHAKEVTGIAFDPAGKSVYTSSLDGTVKRWATDGKGEMLAKTEPVHDQSIVSGLAYVAYAPPRILFDPSGIHAADPETLKPLPKLAIAGAGTWRAAPPSSHLILTGGPTGMTVWDRYVRHPGRDFTDPDLGGIANRGMNRVAVSPDGTLVASLGGADDGTLRLWDLPSGRVALRLTLGEVYGAGFSPDGRRLVVTARGRTVIYEVRREACHETLAAQAQEVRTFDVRPNGKLVTLATSLWLDAPGVTHNLLAEWDKVGDPPRPLLSQARNTQDLSYGLTTFSDGLVFSGSPMWIDREIDGKLFPLGYKVAVAGSSYVFDTDRGGRLLWMVSGDRLTLIDVSTWAPVGEWRNLLSEFATGLSGLECVDVVDRWGVVGGRDGAIRLIRNEAPAAGKEIKPVAHWTGHYGPVTAIALNGDESLAASGSQNGWVVLRRVPGGEVVTEVEAHTDRVTSIAFSPDGTLLATGSRDKQVKLWRVGSQGLELLMNIAPVGSSAVKKLAFSPDGRLFVLRERESAVRCWDIAQLRATLAKLSMGW